MSRSPLAATTDEATIERLAARLELPDAVDLARAALERGGESAIRRFGPDTAIVAALCVARRRSARPAVDPEGQARLVGVEPTAAARAAALLERELSPPAGPAEIRALRQTVAAAYELLAAVEARRRNSPRLSGVGVRRADPSLLALAERSPSEIDEAALRRHCRRLEADLEMARLGVDLSTPLVVEG